MAMEKKEMSGGHFNYAYSIINCLAEDLQHEIDINSEQDESAHLSNETIDILKKCQEMLDRAGRLAREVEWLYSGDLSQESFLKFIKPIIKQDQIDQSIQIMKKLQKFPYHAVEQEVVKFIEDNII